MWLRETEHLKSDGIVSAQTFFGEYCAVVSKLVLATFIAVGITPGDARATAKATLGIDIKKLENAYEIIRISEVEYRALRKR